MEVIVDLFNQHSGDVDELKRMALSAHLAGADAVKLQLLNSVQIWGDESRKHLELTFTQVRNIYDFCAKHGIRIFSTVFDERGLGWTEQLQAERYKLASCTVRDDPEFCKKVIALGKETIISTGFAPVDQFPFGFKDNIKYLFCVSEYPTLLFSERLKEMPKDFLESGCIGYSDHAIGIGAALLAYTRGADILEKHFTHDNNAVVHPSEKAHLGAFTPESLRLFKNLTREMDAIRGE